MAECFRSVHERLIAGCACGIQGQELNYWIDNVFANLFGDRMNQEDALLQLTVLNAVCEAARSAIETKLICPAVQETLATFVQRGILKSLFKLQLRTPDKFVAHCCRVSLNSLATCSRDAQQGLADLLDGQLGELCSMPDEGKRRLCQLITYLLAANTRNYHPQETTSTTCPKLTVSTVEVPNIDGFCTSVASAAEQCLRSLLPYLQKGTPSDTVYHVLCLWLGLAHSRPYTDVLTGSRPQQLIEWSKGEDPLVASMALEILDRGLQPVTTEAEFTRVPSWVPSTGSQVTQAVRQGWLEKLHCRTGFCGFAGTCREQSCKSHEQDPGVPLGDSRVIRRVVLVLLKSCAACVQQGLVEGLPEALTAGLAWLRLKTGAPSDATTEDCLVQLFMEQDDQLMECLLSTLLLYLHRPTSWVEGAVPALLEPHRMFLGLLRSLGNDHVTLIDLVTSQETCALLYFVRYLRLVIYGWDAFVRCHGGLSVDAQERDPPSLVQAQLDSTMATLVRTRIKLEKMSHRPGLLPFNVTPLVRLIERCESLYESS